MLTAAVSHPVNDRLDQLERAYHSVQWIFVAQVLLLLFVAVFLVWTERRTKHANADYFTGYHKAMHEAIDKENAPVVPPRTLKSASGHPVVSEPIRIPATAAEPVVVIQPGRRASHRAEGPAK